MTSVTMRHALDSTSAAGPMLAQTRQRPEQVLIGHLYFGSGTSTSSALALETILQSSWLIQTTTAGAPISFPASAAPAIAELRRISGFTWDQIARLFRVSRRSVHFWASGKAMTPSNEEHLHRMLSVIRKIDRGSAEANRSALLAVCEDNRIPFDLLIAADYAGALRILGPGEAHRIRAPKLSAKVMKERAPRPPEELVEALHDRIHPASGRLLSAKSVRIKRRK